MPKKILENDTLKVLGNNGTKRLTIPDGWEELTGLEIGDEVVGSILLGKHGFFIGYWKKYDQPEIEDLEEKSDIKELEKKLEEAKKNLGDEEEVS